ncbi:MAG: glycosyltransferase family 1 protein [bacterium]|nr:glycosyltransferase family 1 protein [bacterium]
MRLAIDASRTTTARVTGTERYAIQIIRELLRLNDQHEIALYFRHTPARDLFPADHILRPDAVTRRVIPFPRAWTHVRFAAALALHTPDLTWVPAHTLPFAFPGRAAVTVHDLGYRYFPDAHPAGQRAYLDLTTRTSARRAAVVLADSQATADDLTSFYRISPAKIRVIYPGVDAPRIGDIDAVRRKYRLPERYFLFLGTLQPRKNIARLVEAYGEWRNVHRADPAALVLAGGEGWLYDPAWTADKPGVYVTGYVDEADKGALYAGALGLVFPSLYEGFGFPVLEAMLCGCPVIASTTSSLPELCADAALLIDPFDVGAMAAAMTRLSDDPAVRDGLIERGRAQARRFTWESAARAALAAFESVG